MWQDRLLHCVVFTKTSEEFAPHYLAEIRHDMRQTTKEPGALGEVGKQRAIVARQPAIERTVASAFERMQHPQGHYFTRPQGGVGMFGDAWELVIHLAE